MLRYHKASMRFLRLISHIRKFLLLSLLGAIVHSHALADGDLRKKLGQMIVVGFIGQTVTDTLYADLFLRNLGGVILSGANGNLNSPSQIQTLTAQIRKLLHYLSPIEADVLTKRFGLGDDEERTFREIGDQYHLSRERIRQIQNSALDKLKRALEREHRGHVEM